VPFSGWSHQPINP